MLPSSISETGLTDTIMSSTPSVHSQPSKSVPGNPYPLPSANPKFSRRMSFPLPDKSFKIARSGSSFVLPQVDIAILTWLSSSGSMQGRPDTPTSRPPIRFKSTRLRLSLFKDNLFSIILPPLRYLLLLPNSSQYGLFWDKPKH